MFLHNDVDHRFISLHDCRATEMRYANGVLTFVFPDGIWIAPGHPDNGGGDAVKTDAAQVDFEMLYPDWADDLDVRVYRSKRRRSVVIRRQWEARRLAAAVNDGTHELEFLYRYEDGWARMFECELWFDREPYAMECELRMMVRGEVYRWNCLRPERGF